MVFCEEYDDKYVKEVIICLNITITLSEHLFFPLGIPKPQWETSPSGLTAGGMGLSLTTDAIAKIGIMLLKDIWICREYRN